MVYATFFNQTTTLKTALLMDAAAIMKTFDAFAKKPDLYNVQEEARDCMEPAVSAINDIYERFKTQPERHAGYIEDSLSQLSSLRVSYQSNTFDLRTLYDIVAWILSVVGDVPSIATRANYYYPLMMIGYVFCAKLIPKKNGKEFKFSPGSPTVWAIMWFKQTVTGNQQVTRVVVGATLDRPDQVTKDNAKAFRKDLLDASHILGWDRNQLSVEQQREGAEKQDFGHCAETYMLLFICSLGQGQEATAIQRSVEGLAANASLLYTESSAEIVDYDSKQIKGGLLNPCLNCEWLLGYGAGFQISNFIVTKRKF
ncbi:hypothetical protein GGX14DRAFT_426421 [Mycena pura]|uniref:Uncharacterized protein n=1 Tax=Mycena pura TaxID=153505 RepID=A0AAD6YP95_9AGAR|nr:hypothetical protein GGX14DRAFT_426421 [Mycena pura]